MTEQKEKKKNGKRQIYPPGHQDFASSFVPGIMGREAWDLQQGVANKKELGGGEEAFLGGEGAFGKRGRQGRTRSFPARKLKRG